MEEETQVCEAELEFMGLQTLKELLEEMLLEKIQTI